MSIDVREISTVWVLKDLQFTTYDEGEELLHEATYGLYTSYESAKRASVMLERKNANLPRGNWLIYDEIVYQ